MNDFWCLIPTFWAVSGNWFGFLEGTFYQNVIETGKLDFETIQFLRFTLTANFKF